MSLNANADPACVSTFPVQVRHRTYHFALRGELDGIAHEVDKNLPQRPGSPR